MKTDTEIKLLIEKWEHLQDRFLADQAMHAQKGDEEMAGHCQGAAASLGMCITDLEEGPETNEAPLQGRSHGVHGHH